MKIRMRALAIGPFGAMHPDKVYDIEEPLARLLVAGGYADELAEKPARKAAPPKKPKRNTKRETATAPQREKAVED